MPDYILEARGTRTRFDVSACADFPSVCPRRLALQIRQDLWRRLQDIRGFSPIVKVAQASPGLRVSAGAQIDGAFPKAYVEAQIADLLADRTYRTRWITYAKRGRPHGRRSTSDA